ncbi:uncharacterized protein LOC143203570 [Rhynchophorus ferrugineus]|uniref:uncharacterized protein LOC143203570 n=1 Tax=Rhynchophorus ferrugineus TaxID=354439 RepID=UPI003FCE278F
MNQKAYSVLFCALLASTFYHELSAKEVLPHQRHHHSSLKKHERAAIAQDCYLKCSASVNASVSVLVNVDASLVAAFNASAQVGLVIDVSANLTALFDAKAGVVFVINLSENLVVKISGGSQVWSGGDFSVYFKSLSSLSVLYSAGSKVKVSDVSSSDLAIINSIVVVLVADVSVQVKQDSSVGLALVIQLSIDLGVILKANVAFYELISGAATFNVLILVGRIKALLAILGDVSLEVALSAGVNFNFGVYLSIESGADAFAYIASNIIVVVGVDKFASVLENPLIVLYVLINLAGPSDGKIVLVLQVLLYLLLAAKAEYSVESLTSFILILISLAANKASVAISISIYLNVLLRVSAILNIAKFTEFVQGLIDGSYVYLSVKIGVILQLLISVKAGLELVIAVLVNLSVSVLAVAILLLQLVIFTTTTLGASILASVGITIVAGIFGALQAAALISALAVFVATGVLSGLLSIVLGPVIAIFKALGFAYASAVSKFQGLLKAFFKVSIGFGSASDADVEAVKKIQAQLSAYVSKGGSYFVAASGYVSVSVSASASGSVSVGS